MRRCGPAITERLWSIFGARDGTVAALGRKSMVRTRVRLRTPQSDLQRHAQIVFI